MKVWYNKIHDSRRTMVEVSEPSITIGRDGSNTIVLQSPLVSKRHAVITQQNGKLRLENVGIKGNGHMMMIEKNNLEIADFIDRWIVKTVK